MLWPESGDENLIMTFPIMKRINTELFVEKRAALNTQKQSSINKGLR